MRKFILIAAMVLVSATAQAGASRGLTVASNDEPAAVAQPKSSDAVKPAETAAPSEASKPVEAPKYVARPAAVETTAEAPKAEQAQAVAGKDAQPLKTEKPKRKRYSTEARVISELHRHGIYW